MFSVAATVRSSTKNWLLENFDFDEDQILFLDNITDKYYFVLGSNLSSALIGKQNIKLNYPPKPSNVSKSRKKLSCHGSVYYNYDPFTGTTTVAYYFSIDIEWPDEEEED